MNEYKGPIYLQLHLQSHCSNEFVKNELHAEHTDPDLWNSSWSTQEVLLYILERWKLKRDGLNVETEILRLQRALHPYSIISRVLLRGPLHSSEQWMENSMEDLQKHLHAQAYGYKYTS